MRLAMMTPSPFCDSIFCVNSVSSMQHLMRNIFASTRADFVLLYGIAGFPWGAVLGVRSAAWLLQASDEQRRNAPQGKPALRVVPQCGSRVVALLAKAISISCVATPSGEPHWGTTIPYSKTKSALM